jgi:Uma2 family endonuclease
MNKDVLRKAVEVAGGQTALAEQIGKTQGHVSKWLQRGYIPPESVLPIERATGIPRYDLRPDLYPAAQMSFRPHDMQMTTQAAEGLARRRWTVAEIEAAVCLGILPEDERFELIGGEAVPMPPKGSRHENYKASLLDFWMRNSDGSFRIVPETTFRFDESTFLEPDFVFYDAEFKLTELSPATTLMAVEVSDSSLAYDKGRKARIYANFGVKVLWVIDVDLLETHIFEHPGLEGYQVKRLIGPTELLTPDFAPALAVKLADLPLI